MNREEIRKKWKNRELAEISQKKLARNEQIIQNPNAYRQTFGLGNINLKQRPVVKNEDGSISTVRSMSFYDDNEKKEILVPTVVNGKIVSDDEAIKHYYKTGQYLGKFNTPDEATDYALKLHDSQEKMYSNQGSSWERVQNTANQIMNIRNNPIINVENPLLNRGKTQDNKQLNKKQYIADDARALVKGIGLGGYKGGVTALGQTEFLSQQRSDTYRKYNQRATRIKEQQEAKTADEQLQLGLKQLGNAKASNGILMQKQPSINESASMQYFNKKEEELNKKIAQNAETASTNVGKYLAGQVAPSMGQSLVGTGLDIIAPGMGAGYRMLSYSGNYTQDGLNKGMNENQASMYGLTMAGVETAMDTIGDKLKGIAIGEAKGANGLKNFIKTSAKELGINSFFEGSGEALTEPLQELVAKAYGGKADYEGIAKRMGEAFLAGAVSELLMTGASLGYGGSINVLNKTENGQQVSVEEVKNALNEIKDKKQVNVEEILQNNLQFAENNLQQENQATTTPNNEILNQEQQTIQQEGKQAQNELSSQIGEKEQKALNLRQSIDNFNNSRTEGQEIFDINNEETRKEIESIQKIAQDRNINIIFDENRFKNSNENAFYEYDKNNNVANIVLNPNSTSKKYVQNLVIHEMTHSFEGSKEYNNLSKAILDYAKSKGEYDSAFKDLMNTYSKVYSGENLNEIVEKEAVANILGEKLGDKEFVDSLVNNQYVERSTIQKIIDFIKNQINRFKGYKDQEAYWNNVKTLFEDAYNKSEVSKEGLKASVENNNNYEKVFDGEKEYYRKKIREFKDNNGHTFTLYEKPNKHNELTIKTEGVSGIKTISGSRNKILSEIQKYWKGQGTFTEINNRQMSIETSTTDSQGRELSKEQQEYFKDSKVRDENGNLKTMYHGTEANVGIPKEYWFSIFDVGRQGNNGSWFGNGFYFTENEEHAKEYAHSKGNVYEVYLDVKKPYIPYQNGNSMLSFQEDFKNNFEEARDIDGKLTGQQITDILKKNGYDGIIIGDNTVVFNSNQIKNVDNANPTNNPDIRYSQDTTGEWNNFIEKYFKNEGTGTAIKDMKKLPEMSITKYQEVLDNAKYIPQEDKQNLLSYLEDIKKNKSSLDDFKKIVNDLNNTYKQDNILDTTETYSTGRKEKYQKYLKSKTDYDNSALKNALDIIPANKQGRRTKEQWLNVAKQIGTEIANKSNQEIEEIAFRTWQDERPSSKESMNRQGQKFVPFNSDEWINAIYDSVNEQRQYSIDTEQQAEQPVEQTVKEEKINLLPNKKVESEQTKQRKHYESIMKSSETSKEAKSIAKKLLGTDTYVPDSNKAQLERADQRIGANPDNELNVLTSKIDNGDRLNATDIAVSERLIEYYSKIGDLEKLETAIQNTALAGTQLGQSVQALSLINRQTPVGQVTYIERTIKKLNQEILNNKGYTQNSEGKILNKKGEDVTDKVELFDFTSEMQQKILNSNKDNIDKVLDEVYDELGNQVTKSTHQKIDSWRYFSMLSNIRTHLRNIVGNFAMGKTQQVKNLISASAEGVAGMINPEMERTKTLRRSNKITKQFAKNDIKNVASELGLNSNKYTAQNRLKDNMREFKSDALNSTLGKLYNLNNTLLEVEDGWGLKSAYVRAFSNYITANKLDVKNISDTNLRKARKYAINEAQEATFHQASALASAINQFSARSKVGKAITDSNLPFVKTPINVAKTGLEYNPAGLVYNSVKGIHDLNTGKITVNQYIDNISKGLTGTGISLLGYALAEAGIVKASGGDDDKEKYEKDRGSQAYSIKIGDNTYSLDWLAPVGIPFFVGVEAHEIINEKKKQKTAKSTDDDSLYKQGIQSATNILNAFATSMNPMAEMSMLSGLTSALRSFDQGVGMIGSLIANAGQSYINQFEPTLLKQVARVTDSKQRTTKSTATGTLGKAVDQTKNQIMAGIPGLRQKLPVATDIWGEELENDDNITRRAFETFIAPYTRKDLKTSRLDSELNDLYDKTGETSIYPSKLKKDLTIDNETYKFTNEEYIKYSKDYGQNSYNILSNLVTSNDYQNLSDSDKQKAIEKAYEYAKEVNKVNYAKKINKEDTVETDALYDVMSNIPNDTEKGKYLVYLVETSGDDVKDTEKKSYLLNSNMKDSTKEVIYRNSLGKKDKLYNTLYDIDKVNINGYLDYSSRDIKSDPDEESNVEGDTIYGTKKINVANALNEISNLSLFDKLYIYGKSYKLDSNERKIVDNGIKNSNLTQEEKDEAYKDLSKSNIIKYKDGSYKWK